MSELSEALKQAGADPDLAKLATPGGDVQGEVSRLRRRFPAAFRGTVAGDVNAMTLPAADYAAAKAAILRAPLAASVVEPDLVQHPGTVTGTTTSTARVPAARTVVAMDARSMTKPEYEASKRALLGQTVRIAR